MRYRGDTDEIQRRYLGDTEKIQRRYRENTEEIQRTDFCRSVLLEQTLV
jgi:hypothetical protein